MDSPRSPAAYVLAHPGSFAWCVLKRFKANQGLLLAGAVAYYTLLSIVPLLILLLMALAHVVDAAPLLATLARYLELVVPGQSQALVEELAGFLTHREIVGPVLLVTLLFFSSLAFTVLENSLSVIFFHRIAIRRRRFLVSALIPYGYILILGIGFLAITIVSGALEALATEDVWILGQMRSLGRLAGVLLYLMGVIGEILVLTSIYIVMPVGRLSWRRALIGGVAAAILWEITRHALRWYFAGLSQVTVVYGSLATAIFVLLSLEIAATILLIGAQVIAEYERIGREGPGAQQPTPPKLDASEARESASS